MTRTYTKRPVWTWHCDRCGATSGDLAYQQSLLPSPASMRERGWFIAQTWGDLCPRCAQTPVGVRATTSTKRLTAPVIAHLTKGDENDE